VIPAQALSSVRVARKSPPTEQRWHRHLQKVAVGRDYGDRVEIQGVDRANDLTPAETAREGAKIIPVTTGPGAMTTSPQKYWSCQSLAPT
jgi:hypothetical protein